MSAAAAAATPDDTDQPALRPWWAELGSVVPRSVAYSVRAARPRVMRGDDGTPDDTGVPALSPSPLTWATVALDEFAMSAAYLITRRGAQEVSVAAQLAAQTAVDRLRRAGVLANPSLLYPEPALPAALRRSDRSRGGVEFEHVSFASSWRPPAPLPADVPWDAPDGNGRAHAFLLRHGDRPRPWVVVLHGHRMGEPRDLRMLGSRRLAADLGVDVAHLVLPLHGPRSRGLKHPFPGLDPVLNLIGMAQAAHDARALIAWLRGQSATRVAVFGISLGGHVAALLAGLDAELAAVVAGVPTADVSTMLADTMGGHWGSEVVDRSHVLDEAAVTLSRLASPLTFPPVLERDRLFIYAAVGDRLVTPQQALALWRHWDRPAIRWLQGGHILNNARAARNFVALALRSSGVAA
jgi:hypothetical protein